MAAMRVLLALVTAAFIPATQSELVIARQGTKEYHRPYCDVVRKGGDDLLAMTREQAEARGLKPHATCDPAKNPEPTIDPRTGKLLPPPKPVHVFLDGSKYYHREKCSKLGTSPKRVRLDEAAKKHWPCPACKPPIRPRKPRTDAGSRDLHGTAGLR